MQDIDFDELDRAVSSASGPTPPADTSSSDNVTVTNRSTPRPETSPAPAARRSSGRFMDVVHPSSDMRTSTSTPERSAPREPEEDQQESEKPAERSTDWPDPLDFHGFTIDEPEKAEEAPEPEPAQEEETSRPLESPFLNGTKVEKRPLGAFSTAETPVASEPDTLLLEAPDEELLTAETEEKTEDTPVPEPAVEEETPQPVIEPTPEPTPIQEEPQGPTSITQQYKEQPSTADQPSGAIYDTETYHQPLTHTPKKKSGALVIVWILALILVGAGAGAAVYFFVLPML